MTELENSARSRLAKPSMSFDEWLEYGMDQGWCGPSVCETHDGLPVSDGEISQFEDGWDPCLHILRLYPDEITRRAVERDHSPSVWRKANRKANRK